MKIKIECETGPYFGASRYAYETFHPERVPALIDRVREIDARGLLECGEAADIAAAYAGACSQFTMVPGNHTRRLAALDARKRQLRAALETALDRALEVTS